MTICNHHLEQFGRISERNKTKMLWYDQSAQKKSQSKKIISSDMAVNLKQKGHSYTWTATLPSMYQPI